jgi:hypothetical protein
MEGEREERGGEGDEGEGKGGCRRSCVSIGVLRVTYVVRRSVG